MPPKKEEPIPSIRMEDLGAIQDYINRALDWHNKTVISFICQDADLRNALILLGKK